MFEYDKQENINKKIYVNSRAVWKLMNGSYKFANWIKYAIARLELKQGVDYYIKEETVKGYKEINYYVEENIVKYLAMIGNSKKGIEIVKYYSRLNKELLRLKDEKINSLLIDVDKINYMSFRRWSEYIERHSKCKVSPVYLKNYMIKEGYLVKIPQSSGYGAGFNAIEKWDGVTKNGIEIVPSEEAENNKWIKFEKKLSSATKLQVSNEFRTKMLEKILDSIGY